MRSRRVTVVTVLGCLLVTGTVAGASDDSASDPFARSAEVVALVLAQDARFGGLPDYRRLEIEQASEFSLDPIVGSGFYRELPTTASSLTPWVDLGYPASRLVEITLVGDCTPLSTESSSIDAWPWPDPCEWRHSWVYRVAPDDTVTLLFEEGDPDPRLAG